MSFPPATEMFQFTGFASRTYGFSTGYSLLGGLPHSEIPGSTIARISPGLIAACHVLHRLSVPRHPPNALPQRLIAKPVVRRDKPRKHNASRMKTLSPKKLPQRSSQPPAALTHSAPLDTPSSLCQRSSAMTAPAKLALPNPWPVARPEPRSAPSRSRGQLRYR